MGRPSLAPGRYFRLLLIGYFEGLDSGRGIAWRGGFLRDPAVLHLELPEAGLLKGRMVGIDATTLEANAALRSVVRRDTGETYRSRGRRHP